jgi:hypothetical protein
LSILQFQRHTKCKGLQTSQKTKRTADAVLFEPQGV